MDRRPLNVVLVYPPAADPGQPYSSLPALTAFLRAKGGVSVRQFDLNIELCREFLRRGSIEKAGRAVREELAKVGSEQGAVDDDKQARLVRAALTAPFVADEIDEAVAELRRIECYRSPERLNRAKRSVFNALQLLGAASDYLGFDAKTASKKRFGRMADIAAAVADARNPFTDFIAKRFLPRLAAADPGLVGISLTYGSQIVAAFTLAREIRRSMPRVKLVVGGQIASAWYPALDEAAELFDWFDYLIAFEGESALFGLLEALRAGEQPDRVPNLVWRKGETVVRNRLAVETIDELPTPDYDGLPLAEYLTPEPVFLLSASRGCYWDRCAFCSVSPSFRGRYRQRDADLVHRDIDTLVERHGARYLSFGDDCLHPRLLRQLALRLPTGPALSWQGEVRFEAGIDDDLIDSLRASGCVNLVFGLESRSERVLKLMDKGVDAREIVRILDRCGRNGIACNLQFFFGFPGETVDEARCTRDFVLERAKGKTTFSYGIFNLVRGSRVEADPAAFGIERVDRSAGPLAVTYPYVPAPDSAQRAKAELRESLLRRCRHPHLGLSLTAQSLVFLAETVGEPLGLYASDSEKVPAIENHDLMHSRWRRNDRIGADVFPRLPAGFTGEPEALPNTGGYLLAYDRDTDKTVILSRPAFWLLERLDGRRSLEDLIGEVADLSETERALAAGNLREALSGLIKHGLVTSARGNTRTENGLDRRKIGRAIPSGAPRCRPKHPPRRGAPRSRGAT